MNECLFFCFFLFGAPAITKMMFLFKNYFERRDRRVPIDYFDSKNLGIVEHFKQNSQDWP